MDANERHQHWFAICVRGRWEKVVAAALHNKGYECLLPLYRLRRRWSDRVKEIWLPLFPTYVFCRFDPLRRLPVLTIPGVLQIVGVARIPTPVDDSEIASIQAIIASGVLATPWRFVEVGHIVRIEEGPLRGITGIVTQVKSEYKLIVSVTLLKRSVAVEMDPAWLSLASETSLARRSWAVLRPSSVIPA